MRMRAIHEIVRPSGQSRATGEKDENGNPIVLLVAEYIQPGEYFDTRDEAEAAQLLEARACRPAGRGEEQLSAIGPDEEEVEEAFALAQVLHTGPGVRDSVAEAEEEDLL